VNFKFLKPASADAGYLNAGIFGFAGSGKTFTATELAIGTRAFFGLTGPIAMFDTEKGSNYVASRVREATGQELLVVRSRSLDDLIGTAKECEEAGVSVFIADSLSAVWKEVVTAFMSELNAMRKAKGWRLFEKPEFQHWDPIKTRWQVWTDWYLNARMHTIACGRAGHEYDFDKDESGKKELVKTGVKMKAEGEFGYEPSLLIEMQRRQVDDGSGNFNIERRARILKDRFNTIDGNESKGNPTFDFFRPHVERLRPDAHQPIDTTSRTHFDVDASGDDDWARERRERAILCEEIQGVLVSVYPSQSAADKKAKGEALERFFCTRSWTKLTDATHSSVLRSGLESLRGTLALDAEPMPAWADTTSIPDVGAPRIGSVGNIKLHTWSRRAARWLGEWEDTVELLRGSVSCLPGGGDIRAESGPDVTEEIARACAEMWRPA
jgi:hypothetical protein